MGSFISFEVHVYRWIGLSWASSTRREGFWESCGGDFFLIGKQSKIAEHEGGRSGPSRSGPAVPKTLRGGGICSPNLAQHIGIYIADASNFF